MERFSRGLSGVFEITSQETKDVFIGSSPSMHHAYMRHMSDLIDHVHHNQKLQSQFSRYGVQKFVFSILEVVQDRYSLNQKESEWLERKNGISIDNKKIEDMKSLHSPCTHISVDRSVRDQLKNLGEKTMIDGVRLLVRSFQEDVSHRKA